MVLDVFDTWTGLQLDIVGFLAILGEGSILANAQVSTLSKWMLVPRLLPAPQALMRPNRPSRLEQSKGFVTGVFSGNDAQMVNHIGNLVLDAENMPEFAVRCVEILRDPNKPDVKAKTLAPLTVVAGLGCCMSIALLALSIHQDDGAALVADILLSGLSTLMGLSNKWSLSLPTRKKKGGPVPHGDVVIRYPRGSFLVVKCHENVARELYFAPETVNYLIQKPQIYRLMSLVGTIMLMFGVICLGNATVALQVGFAASYMILNAAYWIVAALPPKMHWDTSAFQVRLHRFHDGDGNTTTAEDKEFPSKPETLTQALWKKYIHDGDQKNMREDKRFASKSETFTQALWKTIVVTKDWRWARRGNAAPITPAWDEWLKDATDVALRYDKFLDDAGVVNWQIPPTSVFDPQEHLNSLITKGKPSTFSTEFPPPARTNTKLEEVEEASRRYSIVQAHRPIPLEFGANGAT